MKLFSLPSVILLGFLTLNLCGGTSEAQATSHYNFAYIHSQVGSEELRFVDLTNMTISSQSLPFENIALSDFIAPQINTDGQNLGLLSFSPDRTTLVSYIYNLTTKETNRLVEG